MADEEQYDKYSAVRDALQKQEEEQKSKRSAGNSHKKKTSGKKSKSKRKKKKKRRTLSQRIAGLFPQQGDSVFEVFRKMTFLASSMVFIVCLALIGKYFWENHQNAIVAEETQRIHDSVIEPERKLPKETTESGEETEERYELLESAKNLLAVNKDVVGYISIPNEPKIAYPVLQRKNPDDGNYYYLDKNINLEYARAGSIFMDYRNYFDDMVENLDEGGNPDGTYKRTFVNSQNLVIYGHNMHDYSMFGALKYYTNNETYYDTHPIIELESNYMKYQYKVFGMIIVDVEDETETKFDYWNTINFKDETEFYDYVNEIKRRTIRLTDVDIQYGDQLLTLSTCNSTFTDGRLVVFARLLRENEDLYEGCTSTANPNVKWSNSYYKWHKNVYDPDAEFIPYG
ncbi:MAG: class B sortase [Ruminococcus sp.]|nr:class B sortase [Ruminococcus sp.]